MVTREQMATGHDIGADRAPADSDPVQASAANVPWAPVQDVYLHSPQPTATEGAEWDDQYDDETADMHGPPPRPGASRLRRAIPLLWAATLTVVALQHAGEVERRAMLQEPSPAELDMRDRSKREIRAAWRNVGTGAVSEAKSPVAPLVVEEKREPVIEKRETQEALARELDSKPLGAEQPLVEPVTEVTHKAMTAEASAKGTGEPPEKSRIEPAALDNASEIEAKAEVSRDLTPPVNADEPAKSIPKGNVTTSHASEPRSSRSTPSRSRHTRASSAKYVAFEGHSPRYFTIERPHRGSP